MSSGRQKRARARAGRKKRQRQERAHKAVKVRQMVRAQHSGQQQFASVLRSLDDLLPEDASYTMGKDGKVVINMPAKRGEEDAAVAEIAHKLNISVDDMEVA